MNEQPATPAQPPVDPAYTTPGSTTSRRRRRLVIPAILATVALGAAGTGIGYAVGTSRQPEATISATGSRTTSTPVRGPYNHQSYGQSYAQSYGDSFGGGNTYAPQSPGTTSTDTTGTASGAQLTGLVRIATTLKYDGASAAGTGMVLRSDGEVITNHHVVEGATAIKVTVMATGATYTARVVGTDASDDVAVLQLVGASGLATVTTDDDGVQTGESVTAVGDGNGTVDHLSTATGSVLATDQSITTQSEGSASAEQLTDLIEISSDVVAGYSGGATYDADGEVVGMTTAASTGTADPVGYAVPIAKVLSIAGDLEDGTKSSSYVYGYPSFLGIAIGSGTTVQGAYAGTPATKAGLAAGDQITSVGGVRTTTTLQLRSAIASHSPGDRVSITWIDSSGERHSAKVTLARGPIA